jgi:plastocyanin
MSQPTPATPSGSRTALVVAIIALVVAAAGLGFTVYQGFVTVPNQFSGLQQVNTRPTARNVTIEWFIPACGASPPCSTGHDRFTPEFITIAQGDTVNLLFVSNDTGDGHTFTLVLPTSSPGAFQLNNSLTGQNNFLTSVKFASDARNCSDQTGSPVACNLVTRYRSTIGNETSSGSFTVTTPGLYRFRCIYHEKLGMFGWLVVLPNAGFTG